MILYESRTCSIAAERLECSNIIIKSNPCVRTRRTLNRCDKDEESRVFGESIKLKSLEGKKKVVYNIMFICSFIGVRDKDHESNKLKMKLQEMSGAYQLKICIWLVEHEKLY